VDEWAVSETRLKGVGRTEIQTDSYFDLFGGNKT